MELNENESQALALIVDRLDLNRDNLLGQITRPNKEESLFSKLSTYVEDLVNNNFTLLVSILYRMDVSESKLRKTLASYSDKSAGDLIAGLMIERELEKIKWREIYSQK